MNECFMKITNSHKYILDVLFYLTLYVSSSLFKCKIMKQTKVWYIYICIYIACVYLNKKYIKIIIASRLY